MGGWTVHSDQIVLGTVRWVSGPCERQPKALKSKLKGSYQARVHSDQMVLMIARQGAGPCERQPKTLKGELKNNYRQPRDLFKKWHSESLKKVQLTPSQGKKKGDEVADDKDDDDAVRTSVSQN
jgi:hypothetical protein